METTLSTAGEALELECIPGWVSSLLDEFLAGEDNASDRAAHPLRIRVEGSLRAFETEGWTLLTRGAWVRDQALVMRDVCTSGFDLLFRWSPNDAALTFRWNPPPATRAANLALRSRFHLLARMVLVQYPALWWAGTHGRVPLHAPAYSTAGLVPLLAGPGGVGKTTLFARELAAGASAISDNLSVGDGEQVWGLVEPMRAEHLTGRRMPHGRREGQLPNRVAVLAPNRIVVLRRGTAPTAEVRPCDPDTAARVLTAGTYMAGELRRYWAFAATLTLASGFGPAHPPVADVARAFAARLPCIEVALPSVRGPRLSELLDSMSVETPSPAPGESGSAPADGASAGGQVPA